MCAATADTALDTPDRFEFGANWRRFLDTLTPDRITAAESSLQALLGRERLDTLTFLDAGSGSGLFSLAARNLGARVVSIDFDRNSVECTIALKQRFHPSDSQWEIRQGSILDPALVHDVSPDVIYCWGVLHHTGNQWLGFDRLARLLDAGGLFVVALYNDQHAITRYWKLVKRVAHRSRLGMAAMVAVHAPYLIGARQLFRWVARRGPLPRGMSLWYDAIDWIGGWPFEVASRDEVFRRAALAGLVPVQVTSCGNRHGCNEFVFQRPLA